MLDSVVIVNEALGVAKRSKKPTMIFKVDNEKAYDSVRWDFLLYMLGRMLFCRKWINWIKSCLESAFVSVLVNESPGWSSRWRRVFCKEIIWLHFYFL